MQRHSVTSLETTRSLADRPIVAGGWGGIPRELQRLLPLIGYGSTGGVCGRSLTAGKILFTGRQTCSLYLVLWLCDSVGRFSFFGCCASFGRPLLAVTSSHFLWSAIEIFRLDCREITRAFGASFIFSRIEFIEIISSSVLGLEKKKNLSIIGAHKCFIFLSNNFNLKKYCIFYLH